MEGTRVSHYEIGRLIGRGGMGEVYEALDLDLGRRVALKFIAAELATEAEAFRRFEREARLAAALNHPHIATLFAFAREGGRPFIVMELMEGESLRARLAGGPLALPIALGIARDVASALAHAHGRDIIHRDIKPENLMFDRDGVAKVTDFGLAKATQASRLTMTGASLGTAAYMAPESLRGESGAPADVFALGVMLHEMLAGSLPFKGDGPLALLYSIANTEPERLGAVRPEVTEATEALVARTLAKDPAQRPSAATLARELAALSGVALTAAELRALEPPLPAPRGGARERHTEELEVERAGTAITPRRGVELDHGNGKRRSAAVMAMRLGFALLVVFGVIFGPRLFRRDGGHGSDTAKQRSDPAAVAAATALNNRGIKAFQKDSLDAARGWFEAALTRDPDNAQALTNIGMVFLRQGDDPHAALHFTQVVQRDLGDSSLRAIAHYNLGDINLRAGAAGSAVSELEAAVRLDPRTPQYRNNLGFALIKAGRAGEARAVIDSALASFPGYAALHKNAALAAFQSGDAARARSELDRAITLDPGLASARGLRARVRAAAGDRAGALADWREFLKLGPEADERTEVERDLRSRGVLPKS